MNCAFPGFSLENTRKMFRRVRREVEPHLVLTAVAWDDDRSSSLDVFEGYTFTPTKFDFLFYTLFRIRAALAARPAPDYAAIVGELRQFKREESGGVRELV